MNQDAKCGRSKLKKLLAAFLSVLVVAGLFPVSAFAWPSGTAVSSWYGDNIVGADGGTYEHPASWSVIVYGADGTQSGKTIRGGGAYRHFTLTDGSGETRWVYCIEAGVNFTTSDNSYTVDSGYLGRLPGTAQNGIKLASLYGWKPGAALPIGGISANDWYMAAQVICWEYQQQLRTDPHSRHGNGVADANQFYNIIAGRPAEAAYNWMLGKIASHSTIPSFTGASAGSAPVHELKWDTVDKVYRLTLTDTNNLGIDLQVLSGSGITITRSGNKYTFTSKKMIMDPITYKFRKDIPVGDALVVWGRPGFQTMMTGAEDTVNFYGRFKTETYGWARIIKTSEDGIVAGIQFNISGTDVLGSKVNETVTTGANGQVDKKLLPGTYLVKEIPVDRYVTPAAQYVTVESGQTSAVSFHNVLKKFRVILHKNDADTGYAQGDATLAGAVYGLYKGGQLQDTYTTGPDGSFTTRYYVCGTDWTIKEITPSTGYLLDPTVHSVGADPRLYEVELNTTENHVTEKVKYGRVRIVKHTDEWDERVPEEERDPTDTTGIIEQPEAGAEFQIFLRAAGSYENAREAERDILVTDGDGFATSKLLPYGRYTVHQTKGAEGKAFVPDFTVFVSTDGTTYTYILNNTSITGRLKVEKLDAETGKIIPAAGAGFMVKDLDTGEFITQRVWYPNPIDIDTFYTSDEGWLMLPEVLPMNSLGYALYEVQAPFGYVLDETPIPFKVDGSETIITVQKHNMPQKGTITVTKTGEVFAGVVENEGVYQPVYEIMGHPGAVYDVIAEVDIITPDGTLRAAQGDVVATITTGEDATATTEPLYLGQYRVVERTSPHGLVLPGEEFLVELVYAGQEVELTSSSLEVHNERQKVEIDLVKALETDELFLNGLGEEYKGVQFGLFAANDLVAFDGGVIPADGLLEVIGIEPVEDADVLEDNENSGDAGEDAEPDGPTWRVFSGKFSTDLPLGEYYVKELAVDAAYALGDAEYPVVFEYAGQEIAVVSIAVNEGEAIENRLLRGRVEGVKLGEGEAADGLAGALIGLFRPEETEYSDETALLTVLSAEDGSFSFEDLPAGHWVIHEIAPPEGYTLSPEFHHVYVGVDGQVIAIRIENTLIRGDVQLVKTDADTGEKLAGAVFGLYADTNGDGELDEGDEYLGELDRPDGAVHEKRGLTWGGYFVVEQQAPEGFHPDGEPRYFEIREDGETIIIETAEGKGFENKPMTGNLEIIKSSSDGKLEGFTFKVEGPGGYSSTFTTGKDGKIKVMGLRIGIYTVSEVRDKASEGYDLPEPVKVTVKTGKTVTVKMHNEKKPDTPATPSTPSTPTTPATPGKSIPQTGDDGALYIWLAVLALALGGGVVSIVMYRKRRRPPEVRLPDLNDDK